MGFHKADTDLSKRWTLIHTELSKSIFKNLGFLVFLKEPKNLKS